MITRQSNNGRFKAKGSDILKATPASVAEFLDDNTGAIDLKKLKKENVEKQDCTIGQNHKTGISQLSNEASRLECHKQNAKEDLERLHVQIRKDLADRLIETVFKMKRDRSLKKGKASQRLIVEQALEEYFKSHD